MLGTVVGDRYRLVARIGEGGMGVVYRALHIHLHKAVAVKLLDPALGRLEEVSKRFTREAETSSRLAHRNIVQVTDFGRMGSGTLFLVMELIQGESLAALMARKERLSLRRALDIAQQILSALAHAHDHGVIHRDLKPENIMIVARPGQPDLVTLLDFGIAKISNPRRGEAKLTQAGAVFGTPEYMSPEQARGEEADPRSDLYACGVLLFQMISGERPFNSPDPVAVVRMQIVAAPPSLRDAAPDPLRPEFIDAVIMRALEKDPSKRFASAGEMATALAAPRSAAGVAATIRESPTDAAVRIRRAVLQRLEELHRAGAASIARLEALSPRSRLLVGLSAAGAVVIMAVVALGLGGAQPMPASTGVTPSASPEEDAAKSIEADMRAGRLAAARARASSSLQTHPGSARLRLAMGSIEFLESRVEAGLRSYGDAVRLDASVGGDPTLQANAGNAVGDRQYAGLALQVLEDAGPVSCGTLDDLASSEPRVAKRAVQRACRRLECDRPCAATPGPARPRQQPEPPSASEPFRFSR